jgi:hypothetical protein
MPLTTIPPISSTYNRTQPPTKNVLPTTPRPQLMNYPPRTPTTLPASRPNPNTSGAKAHQGRGGRATGHHPVLDLPRSCTALHVICSRPEPDSTFWDRNPWTDDWHAWTQRQKRKPRCECEKRDRLERKGGGERWRSGQPRWIDWVVELGWSDDGLLSSGM